MNAAPEAPKPEQLTEWLDGWTDDVVPDEARVWMARDPELARELEAAHEARALLGALRPVSPPAGLARKARRTMRKRQARDLRVFVAGRLSAEIFVVVALGAAVAALWMLMGGA